MALHKDFRSWASFISRVLVMESIGQCHYKANMFTFQTNLLHNQTSERHWRSGATAGSRVPGYIEASSAAGRKSGLAAVALTSRSGS